MDMDGTALLVSLFVGLIGTALFIYGRKQGRPPHLVGGVLLCVFPWFVTDPLLVGGIAVLLIALVGGAVRLGA